MGEAMDKAAAPLKGFMLKQTRQSDLALFVKLSRTPALQGPEDVPLRVLIPAFITSELKTAFQIGFAIFIPFLIIDMVVASVLMSMGMMMMSPAVISLPFKLMLFVLVDGWQLLLGSLSQSFLLERTSMTPESVIAMGRTAMEVTLMVSAPLLLVALSSAWWSASSRPPRRSTNRPCPSSPSWSACSSRWCWPGRGC